MREALIRLANEGLVEVVPRHGMRVLPVSPADMNEIYEVLTALESAAAEMLALRRPTDAELKPLVEATRDMDARAEDRTTSTRGRRPTSASTRAWSSWPATARWSTPSHASRTASHRARMFTLRLRPKPVNSTHEHMAMLERIRAGDAARRGRGEPGAPRARDAASSLAIFERYRLQQL